MAGMGHSRNRKKKQIIGTNTNGACRLLSIKCCVQLLRSLEEIEESYDFVCGFMNRILEDDGGIECMIVRESIPSSTVSIIGYGGQDYYPRLIRLDISPKLGGKSKLIEINRNLKIVSNEINPSPEDENVSIKRAFMIPFAQKDEMQTLFNGIRSDFRRSTMLNVVNNIIDELPDLLGEKLANVKGIGQATVNKALATTIPTMVEEVMETISNTFSESVKERRDKMRQSVASLPVIELNQLSYMMVEIEARIKYFTEAV